MIFVAKGADFSAKNLGIIEINFNNSEETTPQGNLVTMIDIVDPITTIKEEQTATFTANVYPDTATNKTIIWSCSPTSVATINSTTGVLTTKATGTVTVFAKAIDGSNKRATCTVTVTSKTKEDCSNLTKTVLGYYGTHHTDAQAVAVDKMISNLGGDTENSIWSKMDVVFMPFLANSIDKAFVSAKNGKDHMEYGSSGKINATNNSIDWSTIYKLEDGCVKCLDTSNTKNTLNIPIYRFNTATTGITGSKFSLIFAGNVGEWAGGTGCIMPTTTSTKLYTAAADNIKIGADYSSNCIKGLSINWVSETEGFEYTVNAPTSNIAATYGSQEILNTFATSDSGNPKHWNTFMRNKDQYYLMILSQYLTQAEMELAISEIDKVVKVFNVDQSK